jgi:hypothetical protein
MAISLMCSPSAKRTPFRRLAEAPPVKVEGDCYYDTTVHGARVWDGTAWVSYGFRSLATAPDGPSEGDCYYDTSIHVLRIWDGNWWQDCWYVS